MGLKLALSLYLVASCCHGHVAMASESLMPPLGFEVNTVDDGLAISLDSVKVIVHRKCDPFLYIGQGQTSFSSLHGNSRTHDYVQERIGLRHVKVEEDGNDVIATFSDGMNLEVQVALYTTENHRLMVDFRSFPETHDRIWIRLQAEADEYVYGGGEQFSSFNLRGKKYPIWTNEQGVGRDKRTPVTLLADAFSGGAGGDYHNTYWPQPSFLSSRRYYALVQGYNYMEMDFSHPDFHEMFVLGRPQGLAFNMAENMRETLRKMTYALQRQPLLPDWLRDGVILGVQGGTDRMLELLATAQRNQVKVNGLWIQDWSGKLMTSFGKRVYWNWVWNEDHYPDLKNTIERIHKDGVRVLGYVNAHFLREGSLYKTAAENDFLMKNPQGEPYIVDFGEYFCGTVDLTNPAAFEWYKGVIKTNMLDLGLGGWMADFSEYIPADAVFHNGETGLTMHNRYPVLWAKVNREAVEEAGKLDEVVFFMRAGGTGTSEYNMLAWAGDQNVDWSMSDGLASTIPAALSLGMSGFGLTHFDIGGFTTVFEQRQIPQLEVDLQMVRSRELFFRGAEAAVFTAAMRTHEGNLPDRNYQVYRSDEDLQLFAVQVEMYRALKNYTKAAIKQNKRGGVPLQRPLLLHYEEDPRVLEVEYEYLFGRDLLVAPVYLPGVEEWKVYLPKDTWVYLYDGSELEGPVEKVVPAPLGRIPVFYRKDSEWVETFQRVADIAVNGLRESVSQEKEDQQHCDKESCQDVDDKP